MDEMYLSKAGAIEEVEPVKELALPELKRLVILLTKGAGRSGY